MRPRIALAVLLIAVIGCVDHRAFTEADSWYSPPDESVSFDTLEKDHFACAVEPLQSEAQALLADVPAVRLTADEAARLAGKPMPKGEEYVLLRAVMLNEGTGGFSVSRRGTRVSVHHGCLGRSPVPMKRKALVAVLPAFPQTVYVGCSMAE